MILYANFSEVPMWPTVLIGLIALFVIVQLIRLLWFLGKSIVAVWNLKKLNREKKELFDNREAHRKLHTYDGVQDYLDNRKDRVN